MNGGPAAAAADVILRWEELEQPFAADGYRGERRTGGRVASWANSRLLVTAVHATRHQRKGRYKKQDSYSGGLARLVAQELGCSVVALLDNDQPDDANSDSAHPLKAELAERVDQLGTTMLLDLHGMSDVHGYDLSIGFGRDDAGTSAGLAECLRGPLEELGFRVDFGANHTGFRGRGRGTMTSWAQSLGLAACQIEVATALREPGFDEVRRLAFLQAFLAGVSRLYEQG